MSDSKIEVVVAEIGSDVKHMRKTLDSHLEEFGTWKHEVDTHMRNYSEKKAEIRGAWGVICMFAVMLGTAITAVISKVKLPWAGQ